MCQSTQPANGSCETGSLSRHHATCVSRAGRLGFLAAALLAFTFLLSAPRADAAATCGDWSKGWEGVGELAHGGGENLEVTGPCVVPGGTYHYGYINIHSNGVLYFLDEDIKLWARSILVENTGMLIAGTADHPIGEQGSLKIYLYGSDTPKNDPNPIAPFGVNNGGGSAGITCKSPETTPGVPCGIPADVWQNGSAAPKDLPGGQKDFFYAYEPLAYANGKDADGKVGYFGRKVLAVSYGGVLNLFGKKGASFGSLKPTDSGKSWVRLAGDLKKGGKTLKLDRPVDWKVGDEIVVTPTDYLPGDAEQFTIVSVAADGKSVDVGQAATGNGESCDGACHFHSGTAYDLSNTAHPGIDRLKLDIKIADTETGAERDAADTRAAVALLSRSIQIISAGDADNQAFPSPSQLFPATEPGVADHPYYYGGHTIVRQGVADFRVQGVEFRQMGQGGRMEYYPLHFHQTRKLPADSFLRDSSFNESMTRWLVIDGTEGLEVSRNVGYKSIGHGFYLAQGTETNNKFYSNIGILARGSVNNVQNPRKVPGILAAANRIPGQSEQVPFYTDIDHPTVFWIANGWNDFVGNMAAGASTCGVCYWLVPQANSNQSRGQYWSGYASLQNADRAMDMAGTTPLKLFSHNYCSTAMTSFQTVSETAQCTGVDVVGAPAIMPALRSEPNVLAPAKPDGDVGANPKNAVYDYYPYLRGLGRDGTLCDANALGATLNPDGTLNCSQVQKCSDANKKTNCMITALDHYTSAFHWAEVNFAAIWLRPKWHLVTDSVLSDVLGGGLTFVTGGDYTRSSAVEGHWNLLTKSALIGNTQPTKAQAEKAGGSFNPLADHSGPINADSGLDCAKMSNGAYPGDFCLLADRGVSYPLNNFNVMQRLFSIYDGPANQESNAYLDISPTEVTGCEASGGGVLNCAKTSTMYRGTPGIKRDGNRCYLQNAAIGWKQPNGFYYPPTFHSRNLYFDKVDIRHLVIQPLFTKDGHYQTDDAAVAKEYCTPNKGIFTGWTDLDRQTVLTDNDGSLTGVANTVSVNTDPFFTAPKEVFECQSEKAVKTSPYQYLTTVLYPGCAASSSDTLQRRAACNAQNWSENGAAAFGVPMYRQFATAAESASGNLDGKIQLAGFNFWQRESMTANKGYYFIDTTVPFAAQQKVSPPIVDGGGKVLDPRTSVFQPGQDYYLFWVYARPDMHQIYQIYVGKGAVKTQVESSVKMVRVGINDTNLRFTEKSWPEGEWERHYDPNSGQLTVVLDSNVGQFASEWRAASQASCMPSSYCALQSDNSCGCACSKNPADANYAAGCTCTPDICKWAGKDVDCPEGGCYGIKWTMPDAPHFAADGSGAIPVAQGGNKPPTLCFPAAKEMTWQWDWNWNDVSFGTSSQVGSSLAGESCLKDNAANNIDSTGFCF